MHVIHDHLYEFGGTSSSDIDAIVEERIFQRIVQIQEVVHAKVQ